MASNLRVCLFDPRQLIGPRLREPFQHVTWAKVIGEYAVWDGLQECLCHGQPDAVVVYIDDPAGAVDLQCIRRIREVAPTVAIVGVSASGDAQAIIAAMRAGCTQFVRAPIELSDLTDALANLASNQRPTGAESRRLCVIGSSGGAGATTVACNLAMELARLSEQKCGLIDLDLEFGGLACALDVTPKYSIADVCREGIDLDRTALETALVQLPQNIALLCRPDSIEDARAVTAEGVERVFRLMSEMFPNVVADLSRTGAPISDACLLEVDRFLLVTQLNIPFLRNAERIFTHLTAHRVPAGRIELVLNRANAQYERVTVEEVEKHFGRPVFATIPSDYRRIVASRDFGHPLTASAPNSPVRRAFERLAKLLMEGAPPAESGAASSGLWGRLLGKSH